MSAQTIINILGEESTLRRFKSLVILHNNPGQFSKRDIYSQVKNMGIKPFEFYQIVKYVNNEELLMNELCMLELINDNLMNLKG